MFLCQPLLDVLIIKSFHRPGKLWMLAAKLPSLIFQYLRYSSLKRCQRNFVSVQRFVLKLRGAVSAEARVPIDNNQQRKYFAVLEFRTR